MTAAGRSLNRLRLASDRAPHEPGEIRVVNRLGVISRSDRRLAVFGEIQERIDKPDGAQSRHRDRGQGGSDLAVAASRLRRLDRRLRAERLKQVLGERSRTWVVEREG